MVNIFKAKKLLIKNYITFQNSTRGNKLFLASEHKIQTKINFNGLEIHKLLESRLVSIPAGTEQNLARSESPLYSCLDNNNQHN